jgi:hypothetical protein
MGYVSINCKGFDDGILCCDPSITGFLACVRHVVMWTEYFVPESGCFYSEVRNWVGICLLGSV